MIELTTCPSCGRHAKTPKPVALTAATAPTDERPLPPSWAWPLRLGGCDNGIGHMDVEPAYGAVATDSGNLGDTGDTGTDE